MKGSESNGGEEMVSLPEQRLSNCTSAHRNDARRASRMNIVTEGFGGATRQSICYDLPHRISITTVLGRGVSVELFARITRTKEVVTPNVP